MGSGMHGLSTPKFSTNQSPQNSSLLPNCEIKLDLWGYIARFSDVWGSTHDIGLEIYCVESLKKRPHTFHGQQPLDFDCLARYLVVTTAVGVLGGVTGGDIVTLGVQ